MTTSPLARSRIEWGVATRSLAGELESGDLHLVAPFSGGVLVAAVDGLGHGPEAAAVAQLAVEVLRAQPDQPVGSLLLRCHRQLRGTRGAVMTLVSIREADRQLTWQGVGNVEGLLVWRGADGLVLRRGLLTQRGVLGGEDFQPPRTGIHHLSPATLLLLATDGIARSFAEDDFASDPVQRLADQILERHGRHSDDALVLAVRFPGGDP